MTLLGIPNRLKPWKASAVGAGSPLPTQPNFPATGWQTAAPVALTAANTPAVLTPSAGSYNGAGLRNYLSELILSNEGGSAAIVQILDGSTVIARLSVPANNTIARGFAQPLRGTGATALNVQITAAGTVFVTASGYTD